MKTSAPQTHAHGSAPVRASAPLLVITAVLCQQLGAAVAVLVFPVAGPLGTVTLRLVFSAIVLLAITRPKLRGQTASAWRAVLGLGMAVAAMNSLFYESIARLPLGTAVTLEVLGPLALSVIVSRRKSAVVWALLAFTGVALLGYGGMTAIDVTGVCCALGAAACWGVFILCNARLGEAFPGFEGLALGMAIGAIVSLPGAVLTAGTVLLEPSVLVVGLGVALLSTALPYALELMALRRIPAATFSVLTCTSPAVAAVAGFAVLGQAFGWTEVGAIVLVVVASIGAMRMAPARPASNATNTPTPTPSSVQASQVPTPAAPRLN
jgi:inner membrane transporter RhtA